METGQDELLIGGHLLLVMSGAILRVQGGLSCTDSVVIVQGQLISEGDQFTFLGSTQLAIDTGGTLTIHTCFYAESTVTVQGIFEIAASGFGSIECGGMLTLEADAILDIDGDLDVQDESQAIVYGDIQVGQGACLNVFFCSQMTIEQDAAVFIYGTFSLVYESDLTIFGWFGLDTNAWLHLDYMVYVRVYQDLHISGRISGYGGRIVILRRECRIYGFGSNLLFTLDQAYGFGQTAIV